MTGLAPSAAGALAAAPPGLPPPGVPILPPPPAGAAQMKYPSMAGDRLGARSAVPAKGAHELAPK